MIATVLSFGVLAGLDNLQVCSSLGLLSIPRRRKHLLAAVFSICEVIAPMAGLIAGHTVLMLLSPYSRVAGPIMMIFCGMSLFVAALYIKGECCISNSRLLFALPLSLSLDNLATGFGISPLLCPVWIAALSIGVVSAVMSCVGLYAASHVKSRLRHILLPHIDLAVAGYLCVLAFRMLIASRIQA
jgi:putative Mn2+ efflux pump MntP